MTSIQECVNLSNKRLLLDYDFIETRIKGHDKIEYKWISGECSETCSSCDFHNNSVKPMCVWLAEGLPGTNGNYHVCGDDCSCRLEKV